MQDDQRANPLAVWLFQYCKKKRGACLIGIVVVSHGPLAEGLKSAAEMIVGPQERFLAIGMEPAADMDRLREQIEVAATTVAAGDVSGALVLVDLMGGSPANASAYLAANGTPVICGTNLPMLLEVLVTRERATIQELMEIALQAARDGIVNLTQMLAS
jgi:PTS system mannose-specific IIA component